MSDIDFKLKWEVQELRAEVRRLRRLVEVGLVIGALAAMLIFPHLVMLALAIGVLVLFAFQVSPVRNLIFSFIFRKGDKYESGS
jgi:hypothetical protein